VRINTKEAWKDFLNEMVGKNGLLSKNSTA
jgi:hypothetical protein